MGQKKQDQKWPFFIAYCIVNCYFTLKVKDLKSVDIIFIDLQIRLFGYGNWNFLALTLVAIPVSIRLLQNETGRLAAILLGVPLLGIPGCAGCGL